MKRDGAAEKVIDPGRSPRRAREKRKYTRGLAAVVSVSSPVLLATLVHYLDVDDILELQRTCRPIRDTFHSALGIELFLHRYLGPIGYQTWSGTIAALDAATANGPNGAQLVPRLGASAEPVQLSIMDVFNFALGNEIRHEYVPLAQSVTKNSRIDGRWPRLARETTRAHNRVLARLRAQPT